MTPLPTVAADTVVGSKQYLYDAKGNPIEMILRGGDGSILKKEKYDYQFDEIGNWKKMTASIAVYETGKIGYEPFEITYRTITYYYGQPAHKVPAAPTITPISNTATTATASDPPIITKRPSDAPVSSAATGTSTGNVTKPSSVAETIAVESEKSGPPILAPLATTKDEAPKLPAIPMSEEATRKAAFNFQQPRHPEAAAVNITSSAIKTSQSNHAVSDLKIAPSKESLDTDPKPTTGSLAPPASYYAKGTALLASRRNSEAAEALKQAAKRDPNDANAYTKLGIAYGALHQYQEAVIALKMAIRIRPEIVDAEAHYQLSSAYTALGKLPQALDAIKQAVYIKRAQQANPEVGNTVPSPSLADLLYSTGLAYFNLRRYSEAIEELKQVIALNPNLAQAYYGLALSYAANGDRKSAEKQRGTLESLDPVYAAKIAKLLSSSSNVQQGFGFVFKTGP